ncbi:DEAD/DEAH box helicase [Rothia sp. P7208]|uniref:DEAD/DEAH box helicase n=1 Tax=Rothia sp. P7208 TaxID=3402660 RepID=UPI003ABE2850
MKKILEYLSPQLAQHPENYASADFRSNPLSPDEIYDAFCQWISSRGMELYPAQDEAILEFAQGSHVILATPTGSGKSTVAVAAHFTALATGYRSYYTAPLKALVSEKFFDLIDIFGAENVGMVTGDSSINAEAPIICCTAEILANIVLREGSQAQFSQVIMDEFHFYSDPQRGWAWQVPLLDAPQAQFLLMSATLGDTTRFEKELKERTGRDVALVTSNERPIPLHFYYSMEPLQETVQELINTHQAPVYIVHFSQIQAAETAQGLLNVAVATADEKKRINERLHSFRFSPGFGKVLQRLVKNGVGIHHAGMLPKYRRLVEQLAQEGLLKVICGTDTLGVGINVPIRTVLLTALSKFDGRRSRKLKSREFHQIAGRAGRAGYDTAGTVVVQGPEHEIENRRLEAKAAEKFNGDTKRMAQSLRGKKKKAPQGFINWSEKTFDQLVASAPEPLTSSFDMTYSMVLNILQRNENPFMVARHFLRHNHESPTRQRQLIKKALGIYRELLAGGIVEKLDAPDEYGRTVRLVMSLHDNFALNQPLSPFALASLSLLDRSSTSYALDVLSIFEATLENPHQVLHMQEKKEKSVALAQMKADGLDYQERMNELDHISYPKPLEDILAQAFETYRSGAPWVTEYDISPKSIVRDMYERAMDFSSYVQFYSLERSEGVLLRYLSDAYKALRQTVPQEALTEELTDIIEWLGELIRQTDSSLVDEWERLASSSTENFVQPHNHVIDETPPQLTDNPRAFTVMVRNALFRRVELFAQEQERTLGELDSAHGWDEDRWAEAMDDYFEEYEDLYTDSQARSPHLFTVDKSAERTEGTWTVRQIFSDPEEHHDFSMSALVDLAASNELGEPVIRILHVGFNHS